jgi:hypothetical protein
MDSGPTLFGGVPDVLIQILSIGDVSTIPRVCCLNRPTYQAIKANESLICNAFLRCHRIPAFDPILTLDRATGHSYQLDVATLQKFVLRQDTARRLASRVARSGWGAWWAIKDPEMDDEADQFRQRVERGVYVMLHMADIARDVDRATCDRRPLNFRMYRHLLSCQLPCASTTRKRLLWSPRHLAHVYQVLARHRRQELIGMRRLAFRRFLNEEREVDFHIALQMLRLFLETIVFAHCPEDRDLVQNGNIMWWFLLRQPAPSLARIFLELPETRCCSVEDRVHRGSDSVCNYADALKDYWRAWDGDTTLECRHCEEWLRSWSVDMVMIDCYGKQYDRQAVEWVRRMRGQGESLQETDF